MQFYRRNRCRERKVLLGSTLHRYCHRDLAVPSRFGQGFLKRSDWLG